MLTTLELVWPYWEAQIWLPISLEFRWQNNATHPFLSPDVLQVLLCSVKRWLWEFMDVGWSNKNSVPSLIGHLSSVLLSYWLMLTLLFLHRKETLNLSQMSFIFWPSRQTTKRKRTKKLKVHETQEQYYFVNLWELSCSNKWMISSKSCSDQKSIQFWFCIH